MPQAAMGAMGTAHQDLDCRIGARRRSQDNQHKVSQVWARDVYCFFDDTDAKSRAPFDAQTLMQKLGLVSAHLTVSRYPARPSSGAVQPTSRTE
jgi:hypothetical protein